MSEAVLGLVGLGLRGGRVLVGVEAVRAGLQRGDLACIVMAADASRRAVEKIDRLVRARGVPRVMVVGVRDPKLAAGIVAAGQPAKQ